MFNQYVSIFLANANIFMITQYLQKYLISTTLAQMSDLSLLWKLYNYWSNLPNLN